MALDPDSLAASFGFMYEPKIKREEKKNEVDDRAHSTNGRCLDKTYADYRYRCFRKPQVKQHA